MRFYCYTEQRKDFIVCLLHSVKLLYITMKHIKKSAFSSSKTSRVNSLQKFVWSIYSLSLTQAVLMLCQVVSWNKWEICYIDIIMIFPKLVVSVERQRNYQVKIIVYKLQCTVVYNYIGINFIYKYLDVSLPSSLIYIYIIYIQYIYTFMHEI